MEMHAYISFRIPKCVAESSLLMLLTRLRTQHGTTTLGNQTRVMTRQHQQYTQSKRATLDKSICTKCHTKHTTIF